jgi:hypothetical protein
VEKLSNHCQQKSVENDWKFNNEAVSGQQQLSADDR